MQTCLNLAAMPPWVRRCSTEHISLPCTAFPAPYIYGTQSSNLTFHPAQIVRLIFPHPYHQCLGHMLPCAGAVVFALIQAVEQGQGSTYNTLLRAMRYSLKNGPQHFASIPELSASWDFDLNRPFLL